MESYKNLDAEILHVLKVLKMLDPATDQYNIAAQNLKLLCEARSKKPGYPIELDTVLNVLATLLNVVLILRHEQFNIIVSRAMGLVRFK